MSKARVFWAQMALLYRLDAILQGLMSPWIHLCHPPGYICDTLHAFVSPWIHLCHPGYICVTLDTFMSPWIHLCRPGYIFVTLDTFGSPWIHVCRQNGYTCVAKMDTLM
jgi:hypothetical protein